MFPTLTFISTELKFVECIYVAQMYINFTAHLAGNPWHTHTTSSPLQQLLPQSVDAKDLCQIPLTLTSICELASIFHVGDGIKVQFFCLCCFTDS